MQGANGVNDGRHDSRVLVTTVVIKYYDVQCICCFYVQLEALSTFILN